MCDNNGDNFIATLHNLLLAPNICDTLISIIRLMNLVYNYLFHKGFSTIYFIDTGTGFGESSQLTNWNLDSGSTCHITPQVSNFIPGLLEDTYNI